MCLRCTADNRWHCSVPCVALSSTQYPRRICTQKRCFVYLRLVVILRLASKAVENVPPELNFGTFEGLQKLMLLAVQHTGLSRHTFRLFGAKGTGHMVNLPLG